MKLRIIGTLIVSVLAVLTACKPRSNSSTKAIVTKDRQNAVAFLPMRQYSTSSMLEIRAVSCGQDPSLSSGKPEILMNILESGVRIDPAALYYRGTILVTANDSLINIQGYAISHNCRVQLSVPAIGATGFYALFADKKPELEPVRQTIWLALRGPYQGSGSRAPTLDAFISEVLQATRTPAKATAANNLLDERYNPCIPNTAKSAFDKIKYYSCLVESGSPAANYLSKTDNLPEIREKLNKLANELANKQISEGEIDHVADLFGMNFVLGGSMAIRKTGAVARLASYGLDDESADDSGFNLQGGSGASASSQASGQGSSSLTKGSGSLADVNPQYYKRESQSLDRVLVSPEKKSAWDAARERMAANRNKPARDDNPYANNGRLANQKDNGIFDEKKADRYMLPRPKDPKPSSPDQLTVSPPQKDYQPRQQGSTGGFSIDRDKVPGFDPTKPGAVKPPKPFNGDAEVDVPATDSTGKSKNSRTTFVARCKDLGGNPHGVLCVCPNVYEGAQGKKIRGPRLTVNPEDPKELSCSRKREYLAQEQAKEAADLVAKQRKEADDRVAKEKQEYHEPMIAKLDKICKSLNATLSVPSDRIVRRGTLDCICNNKDGTSFSVSDGSVTQSRCPTDQEITQKLQKERQDKFNDFKRLNEDCRKNRHAESYDEKTQRCVCPSGWVYVEKDGKCHWASMAWWYEDAPKEVSHYEQVDRGSWRDAINPLNYLPNPFQDFLDGLEETQERYQRR